MWAIFLGVTVRVQCIPNIAIRGSDLRIDTEIPRKIVDLYELYDVGVILAALDAPANVG